MVHPSMAQRPAVSDVQRTIAENVRLIIDAKGLTRQEFAASAGLSRNRVSRLLNGSDSWWLQDMRRAAKALGVDQADLLRPVAEYGVA